MDDPIVLLQKRAKLALLYSILFQFSLVVVFSFSHVNLLHPLLWIQSAITKAYSWSIWIYFCIVCSLLIALSGVFKQRLLSGQQCHITRFMMVKHVFSIGNIVEACLYALVSKFMTLMFLSILDGKYSNLTQPCKLSNSECVVESKVYLMFNGVWGGLYYYLYNYMSNNTYAPSFPLVQQLKFLRLRAELIPCLRRAIWRAILPSLCCPIVYYWKGNLVVNIVCDIFGLPYEEELFTSFIDFFNVTLILYSWILTALFIYTHLIMEQVLNILITELYEFPIVAPPGKPSSGELHEVLGNSKVPIVQNLGCFDILNLSQNDFCRRQEVFSLSQPGGHPVKWRRIKKECLNIISNFTSELNRAVAEASSQASGTKPAPTPQPPPIKRTREMLSPGLRNLSLSPCENLSPHSAPHFTEPIPFQISWKQILLQFQSYLSTLLSSLLKKPGFRYLFETLPDAKLKHVFSKSLPVVNAVQGLSFLAAASLVEDSYGVVQQDLEIIINTIVSLKYAIDHSAKVGNYKRLRKCEQYDVQMKAALKSAVKRSIYKLCIVFENHINDLNLDSAIQLVLRGYVKFVE